MLLVYPATREEYGGPAPRLPRRVRRAAIRPVRRCCSSRRRTSRPIFRRRYGTGSRSSTCPATARPRSWPSPNPHLIAAQNQAAGLAATPVRFTRGACRRIIREYTSERSVRQCARCLQAVCRKVTLGLETGDTSLARDRVTARQVHAFLGAPDVDRRDGSTGSANSSTRPRCRQPYGCGGGRSSSGCRRGRPPIPTLPVRASICTAC